MDSLFAMHNYQSAKALLDVTAMRHEAIAANLANVETPGYRRIDVDKSFESELVERISRKDTDGLKGMHPKLVIDENARSTRPDGNTVELDQEMLALNRNALHHEFLLRRVDGSLKLLKSAITGRTQ